MAVCTRYARVLDAEGKPLSVRGDPTLFTRRDGVEAQWRLVTPIDEAWAGKASGPLPSYDAGSYAPQSRVPGDGDPVADPDHGQW